jgi:hypothetical protein
MPAKRNDRKRGTGVIDRLVDVLPIELHLPGKKARPGLFHKIWQKLFLLRLISFSLGYNFCGPGTKLDKRLARGDQPVSKLDDFCRSHDIVYRDHHDSETRRRADSLLAEQAVSRIFAKDAKLGERAAALAVAGAMKAKTKLGSGLKKKSRVLKTPYKIGGCVRTVAVKPPGGCAKRKKRENTSQKRKGADKKKTKGGFLPLLPLLGALGALGSVAGGAASIASAVNKSKKDAAALDELKSHNRTMERLAAAKGKGVFLRLDKGASKRGAGVFLKVDKHGRC